MCSRYLLALLMLTLAACDREAASDLKTQDTTTEAATDTIDAVVPPDEPLQPLDSLGADGAVAVIRNYYAAINDRDYRRAYNYWGDSGRASNQTFEEFRRGFAETESVQVEVATPGGIEGGAGSRYITLPVTITAVTTDGEHQRFVGTYALRRAVVDGASPEQRRWHIYSAEINAANPAAEDRSDPSG